MPTKIQFTTVAVAAMLIFGGSVEAAPAPTEPSGAETTSVRVSVADLDLRQEAGLAAAHRRIRRAAVLVCGYEPASAGLVLYVASSNCRKAAFGAAVADLDTQMASRLDPQSSPRKTALAAKD
jgi:UrcA family protein